MRFTFLQFSRQFTDRSQVFSSARLLLFLLSFSFVATLANAAPDEAISEPVSEPVIESGRFTDMRLRAVLRAKTPRELKEVNEQSDRIKIGRIECGIQLKGRRVPSKCFEVLKDESESGLISAAAKRNQEEWLAKLCKKRAQNSNDLRELNRLSDLKFIPSSCRDQVIARALDLKYASEAEDPSSLFIDRFSPSQMTADVLQESEPLPEAPPLQSSLLPSLLPRPESGQHAQKLQTTKTVVANHPSTNLVDGHEP